MTIIEKCGVLVAKIYLEKESDSKRWKVEMFFNADEINILELTRKVKNIK